MPVPVLLGLCAVGGIASHILFFNRPEPEVKHHFNGVRYLQIALAVYATAVAAMIRLGDKATGEAFATATAYEGSFLAGVYASLLVYRAFLSPLNKFPGPFGASMSRVSQITLFNEDCV